MSIQFFRKRLVFEELLHSFTSEHVCKKPIQFRPAPPNLAQTGNGGLVVLVALLLYQPRSVPVNFMAK